jgi:hypothetical protein
MNERNEKDVVVYEHTITADAPALTQEEEAFDSWMDDAFDADEEE